MLKKLDYIVIGSIVLVTGLLFFFQFRNASGPLADKKIEIYEAGVLIRTIPLPDNEAEEITIYSEKGYNTLRLTPDGVRVSDADCPSRDCVHSPALRYPNQVIACLPHKIVIKLIGTSDENGVDIIAG